LDGKDDIERKCAVKEVVGIKGLSYRVVVTYKSKEDPIDELLLDDF